LGLGWKGLTPKFFGAFFVPPLCRQKKCSGLSACEDAQGEPGFFLPAGRHKKTPPIIVIVALIVHCFGLNKWGCPGRSGIHTGAWNCGKLQGDCPRAGGGLAPSGPPCLYNRAPGKLCQYRGAKAVTLPGLPPAPPPHHTAASSARPGLPKNGKTSPMQHHTAWLRGMLPLGRCVEEPWYGSATIRCGSHPERYLPPCARTRAETARARRHWPGYISSGRNWWGRPP